MTPGDLLAGRDHVLVAFDGPVAELPSTRELADRLRVLVAEGKPPRTGDPLAVLAYAVEIGPGTGRAVHAQLSLLETELVATARRPPAWRRPWTCWPARAPASPSSAAWPSRRSGRSWWCTALAAARAAGVETLRFRPGTTSWLDGLG